MYPFGPKTFSQQVFGRRDAYFVGQGNYEEKRKQVVKNADAGNGPLGWYGSRAGQRWTRSFRLGGSYFEFLKTAFRSFDDYFFCGALQRQGRVLVGWTGPRPNGELGWTDCRPMNEKRVSIRIARKSGRSSPSKIQEVSNTLLHEMGHAVLMVFSCQRTCTNIIAEARSYGIISHGPSWRVLVQAVE